MPTAAPWLAKAPRFQLSWVTERGMLLRLLGERGIELFHQHGGANTWFIKLLAFAYASMDPEQDGPPAFADCLTVAPHARLCRHYLDVAWTAYARGDMAAVDAAVDCIIKLSTVDHAHHRPATDEELQAAALPVFLELIRDATSQHPVIVRMEFHVLHALETELARRDDPSIRIVVSPTPQFGDDDDYDDDDDDDDGDDDGARAAAADAYLEQLVRVRSVLNAAGQVIASIIAIRAPFLPFALGANFSAEPKIQSLLSLDAYAQVSAEIAQLRRPEPEEKERIANKEHGARMLTLAMIDALMADCLLYTSPSPRDRG